VKHNVRDKKIIKYSEEHDLSLKFDWLNQVFSGLFLFEFFLSILSFNIELIGVLKQYLRCVTTSIVGRH
jgi:hypothetical protein